MPRGKVVKDVPNERTVRPKVAVGYQVGNLTVTSRTDKKKKRPFQIRPRTHHPA